MDSLVIEPDTICNWNDKISKVTLRILRKNNFDNDDASNFCIRAIHINNILVAPKPAESEEEKEKPVNTNETDGKKN